MTDFGDATLTWEKCEGLFRQADALLPREQRFKSWKRSQTSAYRQFQGLKSRRIFLFFPTGEGKSKTALALVATEGYDKCVVVAPPKTHSQWLRDAGTLGIHLKIYSHEKFRMKGTPVPTNVPWIMDEYHKLGGHSGEGFKKWKALVYKITAPIVGASATPNYNDPDRAYCLEVAFDARPIYNYGDWIFRHCRTEPNRFAYYPKVLGFLKFDNAIDYLSDKPWIAYIEDTATWKDYELILPSQKLTLFEEYGYSETHHRVVASDMEKRHKRVELNFINEKGKIRKEIIDTVIQYLDNCEGHDKWLVVCAHKTVAEALYKTMKRDVWIITGDTKDIEPEKQGFIMAQRGWLIGTTALAEGVDGLDKTCQAILFLDDIVGDPSKRRQIIGRILPRGTDDGKERIVVTAAF